MQVPIHLIDVRSDVHTAMLPVHLRPEWLRGTAGVSEDGVTRCALLFLREMMRVDMDLEQVFGGLRINYSVLHIVPPCWTVLWRFVCCLSPRSDQFGPSGATQGEPGELTSFS